MLSDNPSPKEQTKVLSDIPSKGDQLMLQKSMSMNDLKERDAFYGSCVALPQEQT
jgi:hypothetical protein